MSRSLPGEGRKGEGLMVQDEGGWCIRASEISMCKGPEAQGSRAFFREQETIQYEPNSFPTNFCQVPYLWT